jgi:hypothetical protein
MSQERPQNQCGMVKQTPNKTDQEVEIWIDRPHGSKACIRSYWTALDWNP